MEMQEIRLEEPEEEEEAAATAAGKRVRTNSTAPLAMKALGLGFHKPRGMRNGCANGCGCSPRVF